MNMFLKERSRPRRSTSRHDDGCAEPGWSVQQRILPRGPLLATCQGCTAVRIVRGRS